MKHITSAGNSLIKFIHSLDRHPVRVREGLFLVEGDILVRECLEAGIVIQTLLVDIDRIDRYREIIRTLQAADAEILTCTRRVLAHVSSLKTPQGILAVGRIPTGTGQINPSGRYIACENIQDPGNAGAILRSAVAFGMDGAIFCGGCDLYSGKVIRGSMGAVLKLPIMIYPNCAEMYAALQVSNISVFAAALGPDATPIDAGIRKPGAAVLIGNEGSGLSPEALALCDRAYYIPMDPKTQSLTAAVAASIILWEMTK